MESTPSDARDALPESERPSADDAEASFAETLQRVLFPEPHGRSGVVLLASLAVVAILAQLATRGVAPALPGVWVGADHAITALKLLAALTSQLFAVTATVVVIGLVLATVRSALPSALRAYTVGVGVLTILAVIIAMAVRLPEISRLVLAQAAAILALGCARAAARFYTSRAPALACGAVAVAGSVRAVAIILAGQASSENELAIAIAARAAATASHVLVVAAVVVALLWLVVTPRPGRSRIGRWIAVATIAVVCAAAGYAAHLGGDPEADGTALLLARTFEQLVARPLPYGPSVLYAVLEAARWLTAIVLLVVPPRSRAMGAIVALALVAGQNLEVPLCAASLVIASLALALHPGPDLRHDPLPA